MYLDISIELNIITYFSDSCNFNQVQDIKWILEDKTYLKDFISGMDIEAL
jgi:hypothetical protein